MPANELTGTLPECFFRGTSLIELYLASNVIRGPLPDAFEGSKLTFLYIMFQEGRTLDGGLSACCAALACVLDMLLLCCLGVCA